MRGSFAIHDRGMADGLEVPQPTSFAEYAEA
jgi:hypothetical protein